MPKSALIVACWFGERRVQDPKRARRGNYYYMQQLKYLEEVPHSLSTIRFVRNEEDPEDEDWIFLPTFKVQGAQACVMKRHNVGMSYGAFSAGFARERKKNYDYIFFTEDDYVFTAPNWDQKLIDILEEDPKNGCVCGNITEDESKRPHNGIATSLFRKSTLDRIWSKHGRLPHDSGSTYRGTELNGQIPFFAAVNEDTDYRLTDLRTFYRSPYLGTCGTVRWFFKYNKDHLFVPTVLLEDI